MIKYRCRDCGYEWIEDEELKTPSCPLSLSYCGSTNVSMIGYFNEYLEEWSSLEPFDEALSQSIADSDYATWFGSLNE